MSDTAIGVVIAAPASGSGKTTVTLGLLRHLHRRGARVASAKAGPDYIDPAFHAAASLRPCLNLDAWAMRPETLRAALTALSRDADAIICEGAMGLFDGAGARAAGSTADLAALVGWPVVMVIDIAKQAASAAALLRGFAAHRAGVAIAGVILNRAAGAPHAALAEQAIAAALPEVKRLGWLKRDRGLALPERHLGLVQAEEHATLDRFLDRAADAVGASIDVDGLLGLARPAAIAMPADASDAKIAPPIAPLGQRIAVARDAAFSFSYPMLLEGWRRAGAELRMFSPLADEAPAADADAIYLPGGYPELHAGRLASSARFMEALRSAAARGSLIYGECGGYMTLGRGMVDATGARHAMAGLLPLESSFAAPRLHLGYRRAALAADSPLGKRGAVLRAHEFHYATIVDEGESAPLFDFSDADGRGLGRAGCVAGRVMGSFAHLIDREA